MGDNLADIVEWMAGLPPILAYLTILGVSYLENIVPPIPGDMVVVFGGYMAGLGLLSPWLVIGLSTLGGSLGFLTMYAIGYRLGRGVLDPERYKWLPKSHIFTVRGKLEDWGFWLIALNRFLSGLRSVISLTVGMAQMSFRKTALWCTVSAFVWTSAISGAGFYIGENWEIVGEYLRTYGLIVIVLLMLFAIVQFGRYSLRSRKERAGN